MGKSKPLPAELIKELYFYDGCLRWRKAVNLRKWGGWQSAGSPVRLSPDANGYGRVTILGTGQTVLAHRVVWLLCHGYDPHPVQIDHRDRDPSNNRIENLRLATYADNRHNSTCTRSATGFMGVKLRRDGRYEASIKMRGRSLFLGVFDRAKDAHRTYLAAKAAVAGEFSPFSVE